MEVPFAQGHSLSRVQLAVVGDEVRRVWDVVHRAHREKMGLAAEEDPNDGVMVPSRCGTGRPRVGPWIVGIGTAPVSQADDHEEPATQNRPNGSPSSRQRGESMPSVRRWIVDIESGTRRLHVPAAHDIELPADDWSKAIIYSAPTLIGDGQEKTPATVSFQADLQTGRMDMVLHVEDQTYIFTNNGTKFVTPQGQ